jgi:DNA-binding Lrp family transcriptional regulator
MVYIMNGYILISTKNLYEHEVSEELSKLDQIVDVEPLLVEETALADPFFEEYDLIVKIKADNFNGFKRFVESEIHKIYGIEKIKFVSRPSLQ